MDHLHHIPKTQVQPPKYTTHVLPRTHLVTKVAHALQTCKLTIISAPAGFGKTTLALEAVQTLSKTPVAWLQLTEDENELPAFFLAVNSALQQTFPNHFQHVTQVMQHFPNGKWDTRDFVGALVNDVIATGNDCLILVMDDYQMVYNHHIHKALGDLIQHAPVNLRIMLISRINPPLPVARLRLQNNVAEFGIADLQFNTEEIQTYFRELWGIPITPAEGQNISRLTEGWVASLHLFALALKQMESSTAQRNFIHHLNGSKQYIYQLLAEEVLGHQSEEIQQFLMETSILTELTPDLCQNVTRNPNAADLLKDVYRRNLFLIAIKGGTAFRYHDLFAEFLQMQLAIKHPDKMPSLHYRAGTVHPEPGEKVRHFLAGRFWSDAAAVLEQQGQRLLAQGHIQLLQNWIRALPEDLVQQTPALQYLLGTAALQAGHLSTAEHYLQQSLAGFRAQDDNAGEGQVLLMLANYSSAMHDRERTLFFLKQALTKPLEPHQQVQAHITSAWMYVYDHNPNPEGRRDVQEAMRVTQLSGDPIAYTILGHQLRAPLLFYTMETQSFERYCRSVLTQFGEEVTPATLGAMCLLNVILLMKGKIKEARVLRRRAQEMNRLLGHLVYVSVGLDFSENWDALICNDFQFWDTYWQEHLSFYEQKDGQRQWLVSYLSLKNQQHYVNGRMEEFERLLEQMQRQLTESDLPENYVSVETQMGMLYLSRKQWRQGEEVLMRAIERLENYPHALVFGNPYVWLAHLYLLRGWHKQVREVMKSLFTTYPLNDLEGVLLREGNVVGPLLELLEPHPIARRALRLWRQFHRPRAVSIPQSPESLSPREMEVLRLMAEGARNQEIADTLFITVRTVKAHVSRILTKMNVQSRTQAVSRARELGLL